MIQSGMSRLTRVRGFRCVPVYCTQTRRCLSTYDTGIVGGANNGMESNLPVKGFNNVLNRVANIIINVTEKQASKILHLYPENDLTPYLSQHTCFEVVGLAAERIGRVKTDDDDAASMSRGDLGIKGNYSCIEYVDAVDTSKGLRNASFHVVSNCLPLELLFESDDGVSSSAAPILPLQECLRVLSDRGFLIFGCESGAFAEHGYLQQLIRYTDSASSSNNSRNSSNNSQQQAVLLSVQEIAIPLSELLPQDVIEALMQDDEKNNNVNSSSGGGLSDGLGLFGQEVVHYSIATIRKK